MSKNAEGIAITNKTRGKIPVLPFKEMATDVLPANYSLSVAFVSSQTARKLAIEHKHKNYAANVLSFRLSKTSGELVICPQTAKKEAPLFNKTYKKMLGYLFIHGLLHLAGHTHGGTMEAHERRLARRYDLS